MLVSAQGKGAENIVLFLYLILPIIIKRHGTIFLEANSDDFSKTAFKNILQEKIAHHKSSISSIISLQTARFCLIFDKAFNLEKYHFKNQLIFDGKNHAVGSSGQKTFDKICLDTIGYLEKANANLPNVIQCGLVTGMPLVLWL